MQFLGTVRSVSKDVITGKCTANFNLSGDMAAESIGSLYGQEVDIVIKKHREKRSLNANSFYWVLLSKLAGVIGTSNAELHNLMLQRYGQVEKVDGQIIAVQLPDDAETEKEVRKKAEYHLAPTSRVVQGKHGLNRVYLMLRGSSSYDTAEMSRLISGLISECREAGIPEAEVMTPDEKERLESQFGIRFAADSQQNDVC